MNTQSNIFVYGGLRKAWENISFQKLSTIFTGTVGERAGNACYSYLEICNSLLSLSLCGGSCLEDLQYLRQTHSKGLPYALCSPDTVSYAFDELAVEDRLILGERSIHLFNRNDKLNRLLISTAKGLGMLGGIIDLQGQELHWEKAVIRDRTFEVAEAVWYSPDYKKPFRLVVERNPDPKAQANIFTGESYIYRGIITSEREMTSLEVIEYYNERGTIERNFDFPGNDFNLNQLPFSSMKLNVVYMAVMAWCMILFEYLKTILINVFGKDVIKWRVKRFIYRYIIQPFQIVKHARQTRVRYFPGYS